MIISASRRTDIPAYYSEWFMNRLREESVLVRNPMNIHQVSKISLSPNVVDGIVFWTKNPEPMITKLEQLIDYNYYFQVTINSYDQDVETMLPKKGAKIIPAFIKLSEIIGPERVVWRYDPIFLNEKYTMDYHIEYFEKMCKILKDYTTKCTISFLDFYRNTERNIKHLNIERTTEKQKHIIAENISNIAHLYNIKIETCAEDIDLSQFGISNARCIDDRIFEKISGFPLNVDKDPSQRHECGCVASIDIGSYNTCQNMCSYCYANYSAKMVKKNKKQHDENSPLLYGNLGEDDIVKERSVKSCRECQTTMFE